MSDEGSRRVAFFIPPLSSLISHPVRSGKRRLPSAVGRRLLEIDLKNGLSVTRRRNATGRRQPDWVVKRNRLPSGSERLRSRLNATSREYTCVCNVVKYFPTTKYSGRFSV